MQSIFVSRKSVVLSLGMLFASSSILPLEGTLAVDTFATQKLYEVGQSIISTKAGCMFLVGYGLWLRLYTKGTTAYLGYKLSDWSDDLNTFVTSLNVFDSESRSNLAALFDKWIVGRQFALWKKSTKYIDEHGRSVKFDEDVPKSSPFGLMGVFDAYVLYMFKKAIEIGGNIATIHESTVRATNAVNLASLATAAK